MTVSVPAAERAELIVLRWVRAFNERDLDAMLACVAEQVVFHPLRLGGVASSYRGRDGVQEWFARLRRAGHDHRIVICEVRELDGGRVFSRGSLSLDEESDIGPVCALHRVDGGLIVSAHEYLTDRDLIERLGLIP